ncbi:triose-phosphate isomerase [Methylosinus sp. Sm6]|uniref:triose-phosphate isomerase n=1 Tax=Methylosinus sp. Sm6 TaxID=2866948 RepID=UPI001C998F22|nr:triose-phosphate isomerase [Methylosinus sp. Sm6]MBY6240154.1 triose-phosphate isomerase [Methylosinus sp. Sm6]
MASDPRPLVAGNWKMHGLKAALGEIEAIAAGYDALRPRVELVVCPPATLLAAAAGLATRYGLGLGGQDCHAEASGAHTGDISAAMLADAGASYVIVGHSERRADHGESDALVRAKASAALRAGLTPIVCVGETRAERDAGRAVEIVERQLAGSLPDDVAAERLVVAYEPVWAIGTGLTPTTADVAGMHAAIRAHLDARFGAGASAPARILYGGSVKPSNARELLGAEHVDGALVGGASLTAKDFLAIAQACR